MESELPLPRLVIRGLVLRPGAVIDPEGAPAAQLGALFANDPYAPLRGRSAAAA